MTSGAAARQIALPELRQDLWLSGQAIDLVGNTFWKIYDPVRHRYTAIGHKYYAMLDVWQDANNSEDLIALCWDKHAEIVSESDFVEFITFLLESGLALQADPEAWRRAHLTAEKHRTARLKRLHRTLKTEATRPAGMISLQQQAKFDEFAR